VANREGNAIKSMADSDRPSDQGFTVRRTLAVIAQDRQRLDADGRPIRQTRSGRSDASAVFGSMVIPAPACAFGPDRRDGTRLRVAIPRTSQNPLHQPETCIVITSYGELSKAIMHFANTPWILGCALRSSTVRLPFRIAPRLEALLDVRHVGRTSELAAGPK
jgi:hypothetical protein